MTDSHDYHDEALGSAIEAGAVKPCFIHSDVWIYQGDEKADRLAYAIFTNRLKAQGFSGSDVQFYTSAVKLAIEQSADDECPQCSYLADS